VDSLELAADAKLSGGFGWLDWFVVAGLFAFTHWIGQRTAGSPATIRDFFLGGRKLPWYAVSASIIATEISAVTLISLPATVFNEGGNLTYLQLGLIGLFLARWIVALFLIPRYFEREIYSPYDYMGNTLGRGVRSMATVLFSIGGVLGQAARVYLTGIVLEVILAEPFAKLASATGVPGLAWSIGAIGFVAVAWTWLGGMTTVIWTDAVLFGIFLLAIVASIWTAVGHVDGGVAQVIDAAAAAEKLRFFDFSLDPTRAYTLWAALIANTIVGVGVFGTDQLMAQRVFCCASVRDAQKAMIASYGSMVVAVGVACIGLALHAYYQEHPLDGRALELYTAKRDRIFPLFIVEVLPSPLKGLIVAGAFAAAISSLDSILAALSQTALSAFYLPARAKKFALDAPGEQQRALRVSKWLVVAFGVLLCVIALQCEKVQSDPRFANILDLALAMPSYTQGALLAAFALAFFWRGRVDGSGFLWSAPLSVLTVFAVVWHAPWAHYVVYVGGALLSVAWIAVRVRRELADPQASSARVALQSSVLFAGVALAVWTVRMDKAPVAWPWFSPIGALTAFSFGWMLARPPTGRAVS
jgi:SSS family solute:Na+ symporter